MGTSASEGQRLGEWHRQIKKRQREEMEGGQ
jgi:hypothetical protein